MTDLDRRCISQERDLERTVARIDTILAQYARRPMTARRMALRATRDAYVIDLHNMRRAHDAFDRAFAEACDDPTGQDLDSFNYGE